MNQKEGSCRIHVATDTWEKKSVCDEEKENEARRARREGGRDRKWPLVDEVRNKVP